MVQLTNTVVKYQGNNHLSVSYSIFKSILEYDSQVYASAFDASLQKYKKPMKELGVINFLLSFNEFDPIPAIHE